MGRGEGKGGDGNEGPIGAACCAPPLFPSSSGLPRPFPARRAPLTPSSLTPRLLFDRAGCLIVWAVVNGLLLGQVVRLPLRHSRPQRCPARTGRPEPPRPNPSRRPQIDILSQDWQGAQCVVHGVWIENHWRQASCNNNNDYDRRRMQQKKGFVDAHSPSDDGFGDISLPEEKVDPHDEPMRMSKGRRRSGGGRRRRRSSSGAGLLLGLAVASSGSSSSSYGGGGCGSWYSQYHYEVEVVGKGWPRTDACYYDSCRAAEYSSEDDAALYLDRVLNHACEEAGYEFDEGIMDFGDTDPTNRALERGLNCAFRGSGTGAVVGQQSGQPRAGAPAPAPGGASSMCVDDDRAMKAATVGQGNGGQGFSCAEVLAGNACPQVASMGTCGCSCPPSASAPQVVIGSSGPPPQGSSYGGMSYQGSTGYPGAMVGGGQFRTGAPCQCDATYPCWYNANSHIPSVKMSEGGDPYASKPASLSSSSEVMAVMVSAKPPWPSLCVFLRRRVALKMILLLFFGVCPLLCCMTAVCGAVCGVGPASSGAKFKRLW
jgi:hypothetical protein